jgi:hypothetical protein
MRKGEKWTCGDVPRGLEIREIFELMKMDIKPRDRRVSIAPTRNERTPSPRVRLLKFRCFGA